MGLIDIYLPKDPRNPSGPKSEYNLYFTPEDFHAYPSKKEQWAQRWTDGTNSVFLLGRKGTPKPIELSSTNVADIVEFIRAVLDPILREVSSDIVVHFFLHIGGLDNGKNQKVENVLNERAAESVKNLGGQLRARNLHFYCWGSEDPVYNKYVTRNCEECRLPLPTDKHYAQFLKELERVRVIRTIDDIHGIWDSTTVELQNAQEKVPTKDEVDRLRKALDDLRKVLATPLPTEGGEAAVSTGDIDDLLQEMDTACSRGSDGSFDRENCLRWSKRMYYVCESIRAEREAMLER